jgi:hypothetical protein
MKLGITRFAVAIGVGAALALTVSMPASAVTDVYAYNTWTSDGIFQQGGSYSLTGGTEEWGSSSPSQSARAQYNLNVRTRNASTYSVYAQSTGHYGPQNVSHPPQSGHQGACRWYMVNGTSNPNRQQLTCRQTH